MYHLQYSCRLHLCSHHMQTSKPASKRAIYLSGGGVLDLVLFRGQDAEHCCLPRIVQPEDEDAQLAAWLLP